MATNWFYNWHTWFTEGPSQGKLVAGDEILEVNDIPVINAERENVIKLVKLVCVYKFIVCNSINQCFMVIVIKKILMTYLRYLDTR